MVLTGPRQSGKTTLLQRLFGRRFRYVSLELPDVRVAATEDPRGFLELYSPPAIFDEVQYAPNLLPYIKEVIDQNRTRNGQYLMTGSQNLLLTEKVTESLAGRAAMLRLLPLSRRETEGRPHTALAWERKPGPSSRSIFAFDELWKISFEEGTRNLQYSLTATPPFGMPVISRPISNGTYAPRSGRSVT